MRLRTHICPFSSLLLLWLAISAGAQTPIPRATGILEPPPDEQRRLLGTVREWQPQRIDGRAPAPPPERVVNTAWLPTVGDQGQLGICATFSVYYYLKTYAEAKAANLDFRPDPVNSPQHVFSPAWGVLAAPHGEKFEGMYNGISFTQPEGSWPLSCIESINTFGALTYSSMPYMLSWDRPVYDRFYRQTPLVGQMKRAMSYRGLPGTIINGISTPQGLQTLKAFLAEGNIAVAIWNSPITANFETYPTPVAGDAVNINGENIDSVNNEVYAWASSDGSRTPSHALTVVGYDDTRPYKNRQGEICHGALLLVNSWGTGWGISPAPGIERGFIWLGYDVILNGNKLGAQAFSLGARGSAYEPQLTGILSLQDTTGNWQTSIMGSALRWPSLLTFSANKLPLGLKIPGATYITLTNDDHNPAICHYVIDLSALADSPFPSFTLQAGLPGAAEVGKLAQLTLERPAQPAATAHELNITVKPFSPSYPIFQTEIAMFENQAATIPDLHPQSGCATWGDADGDGDLDLAISLVQKNDAGALELIHRIYFNDGNGGLVSWAPLPIPPTEFLRSGLAELVWGDLDGDGDLDLAAGNASATYILRNDGSGTFTLAATLPVPAAAGALAIADFDRDGRPDLAVANAETGTFILRNNANLNFTPFMLGPRTCNNPGMAVTAFTMACGDLNGDNLPDLVASGNLPGAGPAQQLICYRNNGDFTFTPLQLPLPPFDHVAVALADFDGDGCDDLLYSGGSAGGSRQTGILKGHPTALPEPVRIESALPPLWGGRVLWADLNLDGQLEAVVSGIETNPLGSFANTSFSYGERDRYPVEQFHKNFTRILVWDAGTAQFTAAPMTLPGSVGFFGPSLLAVADIDTDGDLDLLAGGVHTTLSNVIAAHGPGPDITGFYLFRNRAHGFLGQPRPNAPPAAPGNLQAVPAGNGRVTFTWDPPADDSTPAGGLRYILRAGITPDSGNLRSGVIPPGQQGLLCSMPLTMTQLPAGPLHWQVRAVDAAGRLSAWSAPATTTVTGTGTPPVPTPPLDEVLPPLATVTTLSLDGGGSPAGGYVLGGNGEYRFGETVLLKAFPRNGWRFSHWEGPVAAPLARKTSLLVTGPAVVTARFIPDDSVLRTAAGHTALRDAAGLVWTWGQPNRPAALGDSWRQGIDGMPALAAAANAWLLETNDSATYVGVLAGFYDSYADNGKTFLRDTVMRVSTLDNRCWWPFPAYPEKTLAFWAGYNSFLANHLGTYAMEWDNLTFGGAAAGLYPFGSWTVSQHDPNQRNRSLAQAAITDRTILLLTHQHELLAIGANESGQIGDGTTATYEEIAPVPGLPAFKTIAAGDIAGQQLGFTLALDMQGQVWSWGSNRYGQLGTGSFADAETSPQRVTGIPEPVIAIAAGAAHALALTVNGDVYAWGLNDCGQVGTGDGDGDGRLDATTLRTPARLPGLDRVTTLAAAHKHSLAINAEDVLFGWGNNADGQITAQTGPDLWQPTPLANAPGRRRARVPLTMALRSDADPPGAQTAYTGMGSITPPPGTYAARSGATLPMAAVDGPRYIFSHWEGPVADPQARQTTVPLDAATTVTAIFSQIGESLLTLAAVPPEGGTTLPPPGESTVAAGTVQSFTALPAPQYTFADWQSPTDLGEAKTQRQFSRSISQDLSLTAHFAPRPFRTTAALDIGGSDVSLLEDGSLAWWISESYFNGSYFTNRNVRKQETLDGVRVVSLADGFLALGNDGRLYAWGSNGNGEFGNGTTGGTWKDPDEYVAVAGPDGEPHFGGAARIFSCQQTRFAQRADGTLYVWGKMPATGTAQNRPLKVPGLPHNLPVVDIALATAQTTLDDGSWLGLSVTYSTVIFLFADGTVATWGDADFTGTGSPHPLPEILPGLNGVTAIAAGFEVALARTGDGQVYCWGRSYAYEYPGCLGLGTTKNVQLTPARIPGLPAIARLFVVSSSCFAIDTQGRLWVWGSNRNWELGLPAATQAVFVPTLHPTPPPTLLSLTGGGSQITALTTDGQVWKWGRNARAHLTLNELFFFGPAPVRDPSLETVLFNQTPVAHCRLAMRVDDRAAHLLAHPPGVYTLMAGDSITVYAHSAPGLAFAGWRLNADITSTEPLLTLTVNADVTLQAEYNIARPRLALADGTAESESVMAMPLFLTEALLPYEGFDLVISFPDTLRFLGFDSAETCLAADSATDFWGFQPLPAQPGVARIRLLARHQNPIFTAGEIPLAKLRFQLPADLTGHFPVVIDTDAAPAILARARGAFADQADVVSATLTIPLAMRTFTHGWMFLLPRGDMLYQRLSDLAADLATRGSGIFISDNAWRWDAERQSWSATDRLTPNQPVLIRVIRGGTVPLELNLLPYATTLAPGWNQLVVPSPIPLPPGAGTVFRLDQNSNCFIRHDAAPLSPGHLYWLFWTGAPTQFP